MTGPGLPAYGAQYGYITAAGAPETGYPPNSDLVEKVEFKSDSSTVVATTTRAFEANRDLITSVENKWGGTIRSKYAYVNDPLGRRTSRVETGTAFGSGYLENYTYNDRSELTSAKRYNGTDPNNPGAAVTGRHYTYEFDPIGNRDSYQIDTATATTYFDNALNQYDRTTNGTTYEGFGYDADGNMTSDGTTTYEWDAENRLAAQFPTNHSANKIVWTYDYMNRRVWRRGYAWDANLNQYKSGTDTAFERKFLFDGWNNLMILDGKAGDAANRSHTWGLDLSGSLHGAGGIGGLLSELAQWDGSNRKFIYCYDANGNVGQLLAVADGSIASSYEYEPFGKAVVSQDPGGSGNSYLFSTRFLVNDLYYCDYRYDNWRLGRWMSRDPIGERSGPSLYAYVSNNAPNAVDPLGLWKVKSPISPGIHESLTQKAYGQLPCKDKICCGATDAFQRGLRDGSRLPDVPDGEARAAVMFAQEACTVSERLFRAQWEDGLTYRSHFGDLQWWHAMYAGEKDQFEWRKKIVDRAIRAALNARLADDCYRKGEILGQTLHTIQDSYVRSHIERDSETWKIKRIQSYSTQDSDKHGAADLDINSAEYNQALAMSIRYLSQALCEDYLSPTEIRQFLEGMLEFDRDLKLGGTAGAFVKRK